MTLKVFILEDHFIMRETLADLIKHAPGFAVCGSAETGEEALQQLETVEADVVLVDLALPGISGIDVVQALQKKQPAPACLILSGRNEVAYVRRALGVGARGYVLKGNPSHILEAIQVVCSGGTYLSAVIQAKLSGMGG